MIVPLVREDTWLTALSHASKWSIPAQPTIVIAPHPDDETLAAGGLIAALREDGYEVTVIAVTDGENCYADEDLGERRSEEQTRALARLGVDERHIYRLHLPDSGLSACERELEEAFGNLIPAGVHLVAPWEHDFHPDHEICGRAARKIAQAKRLTLSWYLFWTWHRGTPDLLKHLPLLRLPLSASQQLARQEALECHESQLAHPSGEPILPSYLLAPAQRAFEVFIAA